jgi:hypothetical protein
LISEICESDYLEEVVVGVGMTVVEAEAGALQGIVTMRGVHILVVVLVEGILKGLMATMVGGQEAAVLVIEESEVEVQRAGTGVRIRSEKEKLV